MSDYRTIEEVDKAFMEAWNADEEPCYYKLRMLNGGICYKKYKPSVAKFLWNQEMWRLTKIG